MIYIVSTSKTDQSKVLTKSNQRRNPTTPTNPTPTPTKPSETRTPILPPKPHLNQPPPILSRPILRDSPLPIPFTPARPYPALTVPIALPPYTTVGPVVEGGKKVGCAVSSVMIDIGLDVVV